MLELAFRLRPLDGEAAEYLVHFGWRVERTGRAPGAGGAWRSTRHGVVACFDFRLGFSIAPL